MVIDHDFIAEHTNGFEALVADLDATTWDDIEAASGLERRDARSGRRSLCASPMRRSSPMAWASPSTRKGTDNVQQLANLLLMRGQFRQARRRHLPVARPFQRAGRPHRRHHRKARRRHARAASNATFGFEPPAAHGHDAVAAMQAIIDGQFESADLPRRQSRRGVARSGADASRACAGSISPCISRPSSTARICSSARKRSFCPCLGRTERDIQASGPQIVTVEDSMSMVHASRGKLPPVSEHLRSEPAIVAGMAAATLAAEQGRLDGAGRGL